MTKTEAFKLAARLIVGTGTTTVTNSIIRNNVQPTNLFQQVSVGVSALVIGSMASEATKAHTAAKIDEIVETFKKQSESPEESPTPA